MGEELCDGFPHLAQIRSLAFVRSGICAYKIPHSEIKENGCTGVNHYSLAQIRQRYIPLLHICTSIGTIKT
jgi:hypothetical protein